MAEESSFSEFKKKFYTRVNDFSLFNFEEINLLKVVLDGLKVNYASRGKIRLFIFNSPSIINFYFLLLRFRKSLGGEKTHNFKHSIITLKNRGGIKYITVDPGGRVVEHEKQNKSFYFENIHKALDRSEVLSIAEGLKGGNLNADLRISDYSAGLIAELGSLTKDEILFLKKLTAVYKKIKASRKFEEQEELNIGIAFQQFFIQYRIWNNLLAIVKPEKVFLWPHYHREGCIYAFLKNNVKVIELQHGLIAAEDIFYVFPEQVKLIEKKALFADEIWVYGQFWKDQLLKGAGYATEQIKICGYYPFVPVPTEADKNKYLSIFPGKKIILVTTQTFTHEYFCTYIKFLSGDLSERKEPYCILVKLHPAESPDKYIAILNLENVKIVKENLDLLLSVADLHISIYSTTLFDALRYKVPNYSIFVQQYSDYIALIRDEGIAQIIQLNDNPLDFPSSKSNLKPSTFYFETFKPESLSVL